MEAGIVEQVEEWESEPFAGGYDGLHDLADREFTGAVATATGDTHLFMLNGRVIGVFDLPPAGAPESAIERFEGASGTAYEAPHPSLPLLFTMYLSDGETRAQYYTEDTDIEEVDERLKEGGFTGYIELSENVLSGDYYVVYQAGRSMSAAFVGASSRLYTDEEAFERAADEVGIYEVVSVDIDVIDIPEDGDSTAVAGGAVEDQTPEPEPESTETSEEPTEPTPEAEEPDTTPADESPARDSEADTDTPTDEPAESSSVRESDPVETSGVAATGSTEDADTDTDTDEFATGGGAPSAESTAETSTDTGYDPYSDQPESDPVRTEEPAEPAEDGQVDRAPTASSGGEGDLAVRSIPALDPEQSGDGDATSQSRQQGIDARDRRSRTGSRSETASTSDTASSQTASETTGTSERIESLKSALSQRERRIEELESALAEADDERENLRAERDRLREERDELEATVRELRGRIEALESESQAAAAASGAESLTPAQALEGTDLFVRYKSKSDPTLEAVAEGASKSEVTSNLRLERHTRFDDADATVGGQPYDAYLQGTLSYQFVRWAVEDLLYEIRETGNTAALSDLYEALPLVDRAELKGTVSVETEEGVEERSFDVVLRDRMGDPLVVANLDTSRQPTGDAPMRSLIEDATTIAEGSENLSGSFFVTSSFFESAALETARNETGTGLLSRDKRRSVVKLSRNRGYHLCLVEARDESFHLTVPEL